MPTCSPDHLVTVSHARGNQNLPRLQRPRVQGIFQPVGTRIGPQIHQHYLEHSHGGNPQVGLIAVEMEGLDGSRVAQRRRDFARRLGHGNPAARPCLSRTISRKYPRDRQARDRTGEPARRRSGPGNIRRANDFTNARFTLRCFNGNDLSGGGIPLCATRLARNQPSSRAT